ncbi:MAG: polyprenyl synthetase family protein [Holophagaceae bacterium]|nr:polyprenyl synthetase family protein [Holophagaceae bacterium]
MSILDLNNIFNPVASRLDAVEEEIRRLLQSDIPVISKLSEHVSRGSGKRLRPALVLLASKFCGYSSDMDIRLAAIVELIHTATLIHDDIIDHALLRRGIPSFNAKWGSTLSVLFGDFLSLCSIRSAIEGRNWRVMEIIADVATKMIEGELIQNEYVYNLKITRKAYLEVIERKTAYLFAACAEIGAVLADKDERVCEGLSKFGMELGRAFQFVDDLLDYISTNEKMGKPVFSDLREGKLTLPIISLMEKIPATVTPIIENIWSNDFTGNDPSVSDEKYINILLKLMKQYGTLEETRNLAVAASNKATNSLPLDEGDTDMRKLLMEIPSILIDRTH